jgi:hypothetical protein
MFKEMTRLEFFKMTIIYDANTLLEAKMSFGDDLSDGNVMKAVIALQTRFKRPDEDFAITMMNAKDSLMFSPPYDGSREVRR